MAKLTEGQVLEIHDLSAAGFTQNWIAKEYGVSQTQVGRIARGQRWRHVEVAR